MVDVISIDVARRARDAGLPFGMWLRRARENRGLTLEQLAAAAHTSKSNISRMELGQQPVTPDQAVALAKCTGTPGLLDSYCGTCSVCRARGGRMPRITA